MDYLEIKFALYRKGYTWARVARELKLASGPCVSQVAGRKYVSAQVERRLAEITGLPLHRLFPDRYKRDHRPVRRKLVDAGAQK